jgi:hypothetical protein
MRWVLLVLVIALLKAAVNRQIMSCNEKIKPYKKLRFKILVENKIWRIP